MEGNPPYKYERANIIKDAMRSQIANLKTELRALESALEQLERSTSSGMRLVNCGGPMEAVLKLLYEDGGPQLAGQLIQSSIAGGIMIGKNESRAPSQIKKAIRRGANGGLFKRSGQGEVKETESIDITEKGRKEYKDRELDKV